MKKAFVLFWIFYVCSFIGAIVETLWCFIRFDKIESRTSCIYEYNVPIYGLSGVLLLLFVLHFNIDKWYLLFLFGTLISTFIEYVSSYLQEKIFKSRSWDYSDFVFNLNGRVNLVYSILFGLLSMVLYYVVLNPLYSFLMELPFNGMFIFITLTFFIFMMFDYIISFIATFRWKERVARINRDSKFFNLIDRVYNNNRMHKIYPNMKFMRDR